MLENGGDSGNLTVKWDGAPAIIAGIDPADGKFFVGKKVSLKQKDCKGQAKILRQR